MNYLQVISDSPNIFNDLSPMAERKFMTWLPANNHVIRRFHQYATQLRYSGHREYYSCYAIRERVRWDSLTTEVGSDFKISNDFTPFIARLLMVAYPELDGMFRIKQGY